MLYADHTSHQSIGNGFPKEQYSENGVRDIATFLGVECIGKCLCGPVKRDAGTHRSKEATVKCASPLRVAGDHPKK
jgi:hypothetical protein